MFVQDSKEKAKVKYFKLVLFFCENNTYVRLVCHVTIQHRPREQITWLASQTSDRFGACARPSAALACPVYCLSPPDSVDTGEPATTDRCNRQARTRYIALRPQRQGRCQLQIKSRFAERVGWLWFRSVRSVPA